MAICKSIYELRITCDHTGTGIFSRIIKCQTDATFYGDTLGQCKRKARKDGWQIVDKKVVMCPAHSGKK
ncbi:MAG: hypothetical protein ACTSSP_00105 [Candidatus Asgardarchaeia archaeon]